MIRTVIVDDDSLVHVTLRTLVDWEACGYTVVRDCAGGAEAVKYITENPVDLLITDIKMPETDGLELMRRLRQSGSMPLTVVLSGYDEFEMVREAFLLGAYDYLLKSNINGETLKQLLDGLRENVFTKLGIKLSDAAESVHPTVLGDGDYVAAVFAVNEFSAAAQRIGGNLHERMEKPMLELVRQIRRIQNRAEIRAKDPSQYELYYKVSDKSNYRDTVLSVVSQIQGVWHDFMNLNTAVGISVVVPYTELTQAAERCETLCKLSVLRGISGIYSEWECDGLIGVYEAEKSECDSFITALCGDDEALLDKEANEWFALMNGLGEREHSARISVLLARLADRLRNWGISFFEIFPENLEKALSEQTTSREREIWLRGVLRRVRDLCAEHRREKQKGDIERAKEFMKDNFTNPELTLKTVADHIGFNEKYFSTRFTKECGCTFITYLNDLRIKRAQELLLRTNMKMYEISDAAGYSNVEHFNHMFKKKLGISPSSFRHSEK